MLALRQPRAIFVSHSHEDNEFSRHVVADLRDRLGPGTDVWQDVSGGLHGGDRWWQVIVEQLNVADVFLLVMSPAALRSGVVGTELDMAWKRKFAGQTAIIPLLYQDCETRLDLATLQYISFLPPKEYELALGELMGALFLPDYERLPFTRLTGTVHRAGVVSPAAVPPRVLPNVVPTLLILPIAHVEAAQLLTLQDSTVTMGRGADNDLVLSDPAVSRHHLQLDWGPEGWRVVRHPEAGPLFVNGQQCTTSTLRSGDQVVVGGTVLRFELPSTSATATVPNAEVGPTIHTSQIPSQLVVDAPEFHFVAPLRDKRITLGRAPESGLVIPSPVVSAIHATLHREANGVYRIEDAGGRNGLSLHGQRIHARKLQSGDRLLIGADVPGRAVSLTYSALR